YWTNADVPPANKLPFALLTSVSPDYLNVMRIPLRRGRFFDDHDTLESTPVIVIDEVLAQNAFGTQDPVGKRLWIPDMGYGGNASSRCSSASSLAWLCCWRVSAFMVCWPT